MSDENLTSITINDEEKHNMHCSNLWEDPSGQTCFIIREMTPEELLRIEMNAKIEFLAMMCDVDIDF